MRPVLGISVFILGVLWWMASRDVQAGNFPGEQPSYAREVGQEQRFFYVSSGNGVGQVEYICRCFPGTTGCGTTSSSVWQVSRFSYNASNQLTTIELAGADDAYNQSCDQRVTLNY